MRNTYAGLFFTSLAALMLEILLTRIFSVATWYYFAFFAISVAMFGITVGALTVYLGKSLFPEEKLTERLTLFTILFAVSVDVALMLFLAIPFSPRLTGVGVFATGFIYLVISAPFAFAGVVICLCLTRFPEKIGLFYAADLIGAAVGAFLVFPLLNAMDAPSAIFFVGAVAAFGALLFVPRTSGGTAQESTCQPDRFKCLRTAATAAFFILTGVMFVNAIFQPVRVEWVKSSYNVPEVETWNAFSRIAVYPFKLTATPYSWGLSKAYKRDKVIGERMIDIDGVSETVMTLYDGNPKSVEHLKYDVTAFAHHLRDDASVFVIGVGGGRDLLAAKVFNQKRVVGAEINNRTLEMLSTRFADFTGNLYDLPGVTIINDEARSAITRMDDKFDIIQASCIATWSATTAGAFSLAENSLYTLEGWKIFLDHLTPRGMLSFNRWYSPDYPAQLMRLASLAAVSLQNEGIEKPERHIAVVRSEIYEGHMPSGTILVAKNPFTEADILRIREAAKELRFIIEYDPDPNGYRNPLFDKVISNAGDEDFYASTAVDLSPSTDDRPFFFYMLRVKDLFNWKNLGHMEQQFNLKGISMLFTLMIVSVVLSTLFIIAPLIVMRKKVPMPAGGGALGLLFFSSIGLGYILVEIGMLQRLIIFLGHPIYSITVVIFSMLLASGVGAMVSNRWTKGGRIKSSTILVLMLVLIAMMAFVAFLQPSILAGFETVGIFGRICVALLFLLPLGFFMGLPFPFGMSIGNAAFKGHTPWFWAVNGAASVVASVLSVCLSITWGFTATIGAGLVAYIFATLVLLAFRSAGSKEWDRS